MLFCIAATVAVVAFCFFALYVCMCQLPAIADAYGDGAACWSLAGTGALWFLVVIVSTIYIWS